MRHVRMGTPSGFIEELYPTKGEALEITLIPGTKYTVLSANPLRKKDRGRECIFLKPRRFRGDNFRACVRFVDSGQLGFVKPIDLLPVDG